MVIIGVNGHTAREPEKGITHNSGAAWLEDGRIVAAIDEERLSRQKNDKRYPLLSIRALTRASGPRPDFVALANFSRRHFAGDMVRSYWKARKLAKHPLYKSYLNSRIADFPLRTLGQILVPRTLPDGLRGLPNAETRHHHAHAAGAYYCCPWPSEKVLTITLDAAGDGHCGSVWIGHNGRLEHLHWIDLLSSVGGLYTAFTAQLGFKPLQHEGKIVGLAAYGKPEPQLSRLLEHVQGRGSAMAFDGDLMFLALTANRPGTRDVFEALTHGLSREDIAAGLQAFTEMAVCDLVTEWVKKTGISKVALAGGVFANVKANQRILELDCVENIYIQPNMGDGGLALGAALAAHAELNGGLAPKFLESLYLGPDISGEEAARGFEAAGIRYTRPEAAAKTVAGLLARGKVVARAAGRMEYGPRALGNRTVFASCSDPAINKWLNDRLQRTEFMPFAPIILESHAAEYFPAWRPDHVVARFMTITYDASDLAKKNIPAAIHVDGTARPQVLSPSDNPEVHTILTEYYALTGIPAVINTSFNMHEEPIVCSAGDAIRAFQLGRLDALLCAGLLAVPGN
jgi:carbamoyltransferase